MNQAVQQPAGQNNWPFVWSENEVNASIGGNGVIVIYLALLDCYQRNDLAKATELLAGLNNPEENLMEGITQTVTMHATAFSAGLITLERLEEVLVAPLLKLLRFENQAGGPVQAAGALLRTQKLLQEYLLISWSGAFEYVMVGQPAADYDTTGRFDQNMTVRNRAALVRVVLVREDFVEAVAACFDVATAKPLIVLSAMHILEFTLSLPRGVAVSENHDPKIPMFDETACPRILAHKRAMECMLTFWVTYATTAPQTDLEVVAFRSKQIFNMLGGAKQSSWRIRVAEGGVSRVTFEYDPSSGAMVIIASPDLAEKLAMLELGLRRNALPAVKASVTEALRRIRGGTPGMSAVVPGVAQFATAGEQRQTCGGCRVPGHEKKLLLCTRCRQIRYCSTECQRAHWPRHKANCRARV